jgi:hypothetical protein
VAQLLVTVRALQVRRRVRSTRIGAATVIRFAAALDSVDRFADAHKVESHLAAWSLQRCKKPEAMPLKAWAQRIEQRRGKNIATVALAHKLAGPP